MDFYLGAVEACWLERAAVPLMVSRRRLVRRRRSPRAACSWMQDSGGFTELSLYGRWETPLRQFVADTRRHMVEVGGLVAAAPQDWMCEPAMVGATGLSVREHQRLTVGNYLALLDAAPEVPWFPVLQGWDESDYLRCVEMYEQAGVDLASLPLVGVGTVCRRQATAAAERIFASLSALGLRLHGFGVKVRGLAAAGDLLASADSMAWSYRARRAPALVECSHRSCSNCLRFAERWYRRVMCDLAVAGARSHQLALVEA